MRHGATPALLDRQSRLHPIQCLDLALFIHAEHHRMLRRIEVEPNNGLQLFSELRIVTDFKGLYQMGFEAVCMPNPTHGSLTDTRGRRHGARAPVGGCGWFLLSRLI